METAFLGQAYASRSPVMASQTAVNIYPEITQTSGSDVGGFLGTPGLKSVFTGSGEVRGVYTGSDEVLYAVIGNTVYRSDPAYAVVNMGTLPNAGGKVSMIDNGSQIAIAHETGWHWATLGGVSITAVAGSPPNSVLAAQDNYVIFTSGTSGTFGITALADLSTIDPLDIATAEGAPDGLVSVLSDHREIWLFGTKTTEVWTNTGAALFPFERAPGGFIEQGCAAKWSPAKLDNSVFWLGRDGNGRGIVYRANAYIPQRISTHAIEFFLNSPTQGDSRDIDDAIGLTYSEEGHSFYMLVLPKKNATFVYDIATNMWHQRAWQNTEGLLDRHRANCITRFDGYTIVGDHSNGKVYKMNLDLLDDDGTQIYRERAWESATDGHKKTRIDMLELVALMGDGEASGQDITTYTPTIRVTDVTGEYTDIDGVSFNIVSETVTLTDEPIVWLQISQDAGQSWGYERQRTLGALGERKARARWRRLGSGRDTVWRIATTMRRRVSWIAAIVDGEQYLS